MDPAQDPSHQIEGAERLMSLQTSITDATTEDPSMTSTTQDAVRAEPTQTSTTKAVLAYMNSPHLQGRAHQTWHWSSNMAQIIKHGTAHRTRHSSSLNAELITQCRAQISSHNAELIMQSISRHLLQKTPLNNPQWQQPGKQTMHIPCWMYHVLIG